jgi:hypothetical protein
LSGPKSGDKPVPDTAACDHSRTWLRPSGPCD